MRILMGFLLQQQRGGGFKFHSWHGCITAFFISLYSPVYDFFLDGLTLRQRNLPQIPEKIINRKLGGSGPLSPAAPHRLPLLSKLRFTDFSC
jgi:hypothetical protein